MTLPSLIGHYKQKALQEQFKVSYSLLQQAFLKIEADWGYTPNCYYWDTNPYGGQQCVEYKENGDCNKWVLEDGSALPKDYNGLMGDCSAVYGALEKTLQVISKCEGQAFAKNCIPEYEGLDTVTKSNNPDLSDTEAKSANAGCAAFFKERLLTTQTAYVYKNGMIMIPYNVTSYPIILVDINGKKGPNKWGHDLFAFQLRGSMKTSLKVSDSDRCWTVEKGGISTKEMLENMYGVKYTK